MTTFNREGGFLNCNRFRCWCRSKKVYVSGDMVPIRPFDLDPRAGPLDNLFSDTPVRIKEGSVEREWREYDEKVARLNRICKRVEETVLAEREKRRQEEAKA